MYKDNMYVPSLAVLATSITERPQQLPTTGFRLQSTIMDVYLRYYGRIPHARSPDENELLLMKCTTSHERAGHVHVFTGRAVINVPFPDGAVNDCPYSFLLAPLRLSQ
jgi:hypothetical protein